MRPQWTTEWQAEDQLLRVESAPLEAGGRPTRLHRVVTGIAAGAGAVAVGASYSRTATFTLPGDAEGPFYLIAFTDSDIRGSRGLGSVRAAEPGGRRVRQTGAGCINRGASMTEQTPNTAFHASSFLQGANADYIDAHRITR